MQRRHSAEIAASIHTEGMTPRSRRLATWEDDDIMRDALLGGQVRFAPNGWWTDGWFYVKNNHVFISIFLAHPSHPYTRGRRFLVLLNSLSFAFFVTALFQVIVPVETLRIAVVLVYGTLAQIMWDVPAAMLGTCPCAHMACLPPAVRRLSAPTPTPTAMCEAAGLLDVSCCSRLLCRLAQTPVVWESAILRRHAAVIGALFGGEVPRPANGRSWKQHAYEFDAGQWRELLRVQTGIGCCCA